MSYSITITPQLDPPDTYEDGITYNLGTMLRRAGFGFGSFDGMTVKQLRPVVKEVVKNMRDNRNYFSMLASSNQHGNYDDALLFIEELDMYLVNAPDDYILGVS